MDTLNSQSQTAGSPEHGPDNRPENRPDDGPDSGVDIARVGAEESIPRSESQSEVRADAKSEKRNFFEFTLPELENYLTALGKEKFRAKQVFKWVYEKRLTDFAEMTNVAKSFRAELPHIFRFELPRKVTELKSKDGTRKWLFEVSAPGEEKMTVETVLIPNKERLTLCISSEVGCNIACKFCYTGKQKLKRRLSAAQIVGQYLQAQDSLNEEGLRISNIVFMGMGEPLDNPEAVFRAIKILHDQNGIGLSRKKITVSTSGIVPLIPLIAESGARIAVSLNAPNNEIRSQVMPINKKWDIWQLLDACREHVRVSGDRVTFEYVLLKDVTDRPGQARELWELVRDIPCKINLIPFNEHPGSDYLRPSSESVLSFQNELIRLGAHVLLRKTMGRDIFAACGQLTSKFEGRPERMDLGAGVAPIRTTTVTPTAARN